MRSLEQVRQALVAELGDESKLPLVNARIILRTGVSLTKPAAGHATDDTRISKVVAALRQMGFELEG